MNLKSGSQWSDKCRWYELVDEFMYDMVNVVLHAHASAFNPDGPAVISTSDTNTMEHRSGESTSKLPEPKCNEDMFLEQCIGNIEESSRSIIESMKANDEMKMTLFLSMQKTMKKLVDKL